jgi:hypothetical protein
MLFSIGVRCQNEANSNASGGLIKFTAFPFLYTAIVRKDVWLTIQYEKQLCKSQKFTYSLILDYANRSSNISLNGVIVSSIPDNLDIYFRPQVRYYTNTYYKGYYVGAFPLYLYRDLPAQSSLKGSYWGGGIVTGYQFFIKKRYPLEISVWYGIQTGIISSYDFQGQPYQGRDTFGRGSLEINIGLPIKKSR